MEAVEIMSIEQPQITFEITDNSSGSISLRSLYLWCDMSTNFIFKTSYLAILR
jgi:hypothetical protein